MQNNICENLNKVLAIICVMLAALCCFTEIASRNLVKIFLLMAILKCFIYGPVKESFAKIKGIIYTIVVFLLMFYIQMVYGGNFWELAHDNARVLVYTITIILAIPVVISNEKVAKYGLYCFVFSAFCLDLAIFYQVYQNGTQLFGARPTNLWLNHSRLETAVNFGIVLPMLVVTLFQPEITIRKKKVMFVLTILTSVACIFTGTRGIWLSMLVTVPLIIIHGMRNLKKSIAILAIAGMLGISFMNVCTQFKERVDTIGNAKDFSQYERYLMMNSAIEMFQDYPVMGVGLGNYERQYLNNYISPLSQERQYHCHNNFLQFLAECGIIGGIIYAVMVFYLLYWAWKRRKNFYASVMFYSMFCVTLYSLTDTTFYDYAIMRAYYVFIGICIAGVLATEKKVSQFY